MGTSQLIARCIAGVLIGLCSCDRSLPVQRTAATASAEDTGRPRNQSVGKKMKVTIGSKPFAATLDDTPAAAKLKAMLPLTLDLLELNGNEKHGRLPARLPADDANPGTI